jgi:hypothetical protein
MGSKAPELPLNDNRFTGIDNAHPVAARVLWRNHGGERSARGGGS